jgi:hypothetical protein
MGSQSAIDFRVDAVDDLSNIFVPAVEVG